MKHLGSWFVQSPGMSSQNSQRKSGPGDQGSSRGLGRSTRQPPSRDARCRMPPSKSYTVRSVCSKRTRGREMKASGLCGGSTCGMWKSESSLPARLSCVKAGRKVLSFWLVLKINSASPPAPPLHNPLLGPTWPLPKGTPRATPSTATSALEDRRECGLCDELIHPNRTTYTEAGKPETACF